MTSLRVGTVPDPFLKTGNRPEAVACHFSALERVALWNGLRAGDFPAATLVVEAAVCCRTAGAATVPGCTSLCVLCDFPRVQRNFLAHGGDILRIC